MLFQIHQYQGKTVRFFRQLIQLNDLFHGLAIRYTQSCYQQIVTNHNHSLSTNAEALPFGREKRVGRDDLYINLRQATICIFQLIQMGAIASEVGGDFLQWYTGIVDDAVELWYADKKEEEIQDQLIVLASYGRITLRQEVTILDTSDASEKTRRFDLVEFVNRSNTVRIRELKRGRINLNHVVDAIQKKRYIDLATQRFPSKRIEFIFSSLDGINEDAEELLRDMSNVYYEYIQQLSLRLYINALKHTPITGRNHLRFNVTSKLSAILPERTLLRQAENNI